MTEYYASWVIPHYAEEIIEADSLEEALAIAQDKVLEDLFWDMLEDVGDAKLVNIWGGDGEAWEAEDERL